MASDAELPAQQFRLRTIFVGLTFCCVAFAILRQIPPPPHGVSIDAVLSAAVLWAIIAGMIYLLARWTAEAGPLFAGAIGTLGGGAAFGAAVVAYEGRLATLGVMLLATAVGGVWAMAFLFFGLIVALLWSRLISRSGISIGVVCGAVTGFLSLLAVERSALESCLVPALVGGLFGGFGGAVQGVYASRLRQRSPPVDLSDLTIAEPPPDA